MVKGNRCTMQIGNGDTAKCEILEGAKNVGKGAGWVGGGAFPYIFRVARKYFALRRISLTISYLHSTSVFPSPFIWEINQNHLVRFFTFDPHFPCFVVPISFLSFILSSVPFWTSSFRSSPNRSKSVSRWSAVRRHTDDRPGFASPGPAVRLPDLAPGPAVRLPDLAPGPAVRLPDRAGSGSGLARDLTRAASVRSRDRDSPGPGSRGDSLWFRRGPDSRVVSARRLALVSPGTSLARAVCARRSSSPFGLGVARACLPRPVSAALPCRPRLCRACVSLVSLA